MVDVVCVVGVWCGCLLVVVDGVEVVGVVYGVVGDVFVCVGV